MHPCSSTHPQYNSHEIERYIGHNVFHMEDIRIINYRSMYYRFGQRQTPL